MSGLDVRGRAWLSLGAGLAAIAVASGALGAHGLESWLPTRFPDDFEKRLANWETASRFQLFHCLALMLVGVLERQSPARGQRVAGGLFAAGILLFSGSLYGWVLTDLKPLVMIVPLGGVSMIAGWSVLAWSCWRTGGNVAASEATHG